MLDEGVVAIVPVKADFNPNNKDTFKIEEIRTGKIVEWYPEYVKVRCYNPENGSKDDIYCKKSTTAIVENPMYAIMNEPNSTLQRLMRKLTLLDAIDEENSTGKLNMIIQLPYTVKTDTKRKLADARRKDLENQMTNNPLGIGYIDATEKITQLNRPLENNLLSQIEYLTTQLYTQIGMTAEIQNGSADENAMNNYYNRIIEPLLSALVDEMTRKFLTKTARTQGQAVCFYREIFKLMPINSAAELADKFTRNEIATSNEIRQFIGLKPSKDPRADQLRNANISEASDAINYDVDGNPIIDNQNEIDEEEELAQLDANEKELDEMEEMMQSDVKYNDTESFLAHHASKYYDPVKAHEYYEAHKKLKGRNRVTLTEEGRAIAKNVKENLNKEKSSVIQRSNEHTKSIIDSNAKHLRNKVSSLNKFLKQLSKEEREAQKERIHDMINSLKRRNEESRERLLDKKKTANDSTREDYKRKYDTELEKIKREHGKVSSKTSKGDKTSKQIVRYVKRNWKS